MMGYYGGMMNWGGYGLFSFFGFLFWVILFIDLILLGIWLAKQIGKKK